MDAYSTPEPDHSELSGQFRSPSSWLAGVDPEIMGEIAAAAADVALIVDDGIIRDIAVREKALISEGYAEAWIDKPWVDTVTSESRPKIEQLLLADPDGQKWRQVNHPSQTALDVPIRYTAIQLGSTNRFIALGRDLRSVASLQQRLVEAHQELTQALLLSERQEQQQGARPIRSGNLEHQVETARFFPHRGVQRRGQRRVVEFERNDGGRKAEVLCVAIAAAQVHDKFGGFVGQ